MNKKLIALALAALPAAAMADVTIYGTVTGGFESNKTYADTAAGSTIGTKSDVNDWTSKIGFKGTEDLGNGLKTIWQVESRVHVDGTGAGADTLATRDTFVGLAGNFGSVRLGRLSDYGNSDMETFDLASYSGVSVAGVNNIERIDGRHNNAIRYDSPNFSGFSASLEWAADETRKLDAGGNRTNGQFTNLGLHYENAGFYGSYTYDHWGDADKLASTDNLHRLEVGYNANNLTLVGGYQRVQSYAGGDYYNSAAFTPVLGGKKMTMKEWVFTAGYTMGALTPSLTYVQGKDVDVEGLGKQSNTGYKQWVLGANYDLSKRTSAFASYGNVKWDSSALTTEHTLGVGLKHNF